MQFSFRYKNYAEALYWALKEDAFYITMEKSVQDDESPQQAMVRYMDYSMVEAELYGELFIPSDHEYGVSIWSTPLSDELEAKKTNEKKEFLLNHMGGEALKTYADIVDFMTESARGLIGREFWYLSIVGVAPLFQGKGLGPGLIRNVLNRTDEMQVPTYLETFTPRNMSFYNRLGYESVQSFHEPTTGCEYWLMVRTP